MASAHGAQLPGETSMDEIHASRGQRIRVVRRSFSSVPLDYRFSARPAVPGEPLAGIVEVRKSRWIFPGPRTSHPLPVTNVVSAGFWNTFVSVDAVPDVDAVITLEQQRALNLRPLLFVALLIAAFALAMIVAFTM
jgi:hypothetical protein